MVGNLKEGMVGCMVQKSGRGSGSINARSCRRSQRDCGACTNVLGLLAVDDELQPN